MSDHTIEWIAPDDPRRDLFLGLAVAGQATATGAVAKQVATLKRAAGTQGLILDTLAVVFQRQVAVAAAVGVVAPGASAMVHAAVVQDGQSGVAILERLLVEVRGRLFARGIHIAQALLRPEDRDGPRAFRAAGFAYLTDLIYMSALASAECARPAIPLSLEWITYHDSTHATFIAALESSYIHSLDCPGLTGLRATEDVLAGHRATGEFDPQGWYVAISDGAPIAVLLTAPVLEGRALEIVYVGVSPSARGQGVGHRMMQVAHARARKLGLSHVTLALDATNEPARRLYERWGYAATHRRRVWIATPS
jgi:mycothiol synthase